MSHIWAVFQLVGWHHYFYGIDGNKVYGKIGKWGTMPKSKYAIKMEIFAITKEKRKKNLECLFTIVWKYYSTIYVVGMHYKLKNSLDTIIHIYQHLVLFPLCSVAAEL